MTDDSIQHNKPISWNTYFMEIAKISAKRSKDPNTQVGACIVGEDNKILGMGYNGFPRGCPDDKFPWTRPDKYLYVVHAEVNAILNSSKVTGARLYSTLMPCNECAKIIIQAGIREVIYLENRNDSQEYDAARRMFDSAGVKHGIFIHDP